MTRVLPDSENVFVCVGGEGVCTKRKLAQEQQGSSSPLADSFLVLMILAAYSCPVEIFMQRLTTEKAPLHDSSHIYNQPA